MPTPRDSDLRSATDGVASRAAHDADPPGGPMYRYEYHTEVNKGSINMRSWSKDLNAKGAEGWRLVHVFEQSGNTVMVFERAVAA